MKITIRTLKGEEFVVDILDDKLISDLKDVISERPNGLPPSKQRLVYKGRQLKDDCSISSCKLEENCKVHLVEQRDNSTPIGTTSDQMDISEDDKARFNVNLKPEQKRFENLIRAKLSSCFTGNNLDTIMINMHKKIHNSVNNSSLDDLERVAARRVDSLTG